MTTTDARATRAANAAHARFRDLYPLTLDHLSMPHVLAIDGNGYGYLPAFQVVQPADPSAVRVLTQIDPRTTQLAGLRRRAQHFHRAALPALVAGGAPAWRPYLEARDALEAAAEALELPPCTCSEA